MTEIVEGRIFTEQPDGRGEALGVFIIKSDCLLPFELIPHIKVDRMYILSNFWSNIYIRTVDESGKFEVVETYGDKLQDEPTEFLVVAPKF